MEEISIFKIEDQLWEIMNTIRDTMKYTPPGLNYTSPVYLTWKTFSDFIANEK